MDTHYISEEIREQYRSAISKAREDRGRYHDWILNEIEELIRKINQYDKKFVLGGLGVKLLKANPTFCNQFLEGYKKAGKIDVNDADLVVFDDAIETLLEHALSICTAELNIQETVPTQEQIDEIYNQLLNIKENMNFFELSAENPPGGDEFDHWLRTSIMMDSLNVRGDGYHLHVKELFQELFAPFDDFLIQYYGFGALDVMAAIEKLDRLVYSKIGNQMGATEAHARMMEWMEITGHDEIDKVMMETGKHFIDQFTEANPDLRDEESPGKFVMIHIDNISEYDRLFWVIPSTDKEKLIFEKLSMSFNDNGNFYVPPRFKAFPLNDSLIQSHPLIKEGDKYFNFSSNLAFRNAFNIIEDLLKSADNTFFEANYRNNSSAISRDNFIESKVKALFMSMLPEVSFYSSLKYQFSDEDGTRDTELDILGVSEKAIYIIEVKAGQLNKKHRRGALKGLKERLEEIVNEASYQCHRAKNYIEENETPSFEYNDGGTRHTLEIDKGTDKVIHKISITYEHLSNISINQKYLIESGILLDKYKWTWTVSIYDLMVFSDLIASEDDFIEYLAHRLSLYERGDIEFMDEIDILGFFFEGKFPLEDEKPNEIVHITSFKDEIEDYYTKRGVGLPNIEKPKRK